MAQKVEPGTAVHLPHDPLRAGVHAFGPAVVVRKGEGGVHGVAVEPAASTDHQISALFL
ncbi:hypothetical protein [Nonomuraea cypriaca]|nr:hypothetical protein [Nonomuraea cypriaca]